VVYRTTAYGVLAVRSPDGEGDGVSERELAVLGEVGELVGDAVNAVRSRRLLTAEDGVELEFDAGDDDCLAALAGDAGAALTVKEVTPLAGSDLLVDVRSENADGDGPPDPGGRLVASADRSGDVLEARRAGDGDDRVELTVTGGSLLFPLLELGGRLRSVSADRDGVRAVAEFPPGIDVRAAVERIEVTVPSTQLIARREGRPAPEAGTTGDPPDVTDRQREALEVAYGEGYFEWPRDATAEDVAEEMGITSPTFQQHLRTAHRKLVGRYVEEGRRRGDGPESG